MTRRRDGRADEPETEAPVAPRGDEGAVAAHCFHLAGQLRGGPVRDALLAMGRDYAARARDASRLASRDAGPSAADPGRATLLGRLLGFVTDFAAPLPPRATPPASVAVTVRVETVSVVAQPRASNAAPPPAPVPAAAPPRRRSRLFRISRPDH